MRKMRSFPGSGASCGFGEAACAGATGSGEVSNDDLLFGDNRKILAVQCACRTIGDINDCQILATRV